MNLRFYFEALFAGWAGITIVQIAIIAMGYPFMPMFYAVMMVAVVISSGAFAWLK